MVRDRRYQIDKNNTSYDKAVQIFDKHLRDLPDEVLAEIYDIFQMDVPAAIKDVRERRETIKKLTDEAECLRWKCKALSSR